MFFFFQAEDGIRDYKVTGVQTCALPIWQRRRARDAAPLSQPLRVRRPRTRRLRPQHDRDGGGRLLREHLSSGGRQQPAPGRAQPAARRRLHREAGRRLSIPLRGSRRARHLRPGDGADRRDAGPAHRDPLVPPLRARAGTGRRARAEARPALLTVRGAVLAGGAARRYGGRPKGLIELEGRRILDRVVEAVQAATGAPPLVVANAADGPAWRPDLRTIPDVRPGHGSLDRKSTRLN